jgi:hypothetical protein
VCGGEFDLTRAAGEAGTTRSIYVIRYEKIKSSRLSHVLRDLHIVQIEASIGRLSRSPIQPELPSSIHTHAPQLIVSHSSCLAHDKRM